MSNGESSPLFPGLARRLALIFGALFFLALALEAGLEYAGTVLQVTRSSPRPYYLWSLYSYSGTQIMGGENRILKLQASPAVVYKNMPNQKTAYFSINSHGFRGPEPKRDKGNGRRIVLIGGSTAFGTGLDNDSQTFAQQLEVRLKGVEVVNAAVIGHESGQELAYLVADLLDWHPDLILTFDGFNDFVESLEPAFGSKPLGFNTYDVRNDDLLEARGLFSRSLFSRMLLIHKMLFYMLEGKAVDSAGNIGVRLGHGVDRNIAIVADNYVRNVIKMSMIARASRANFLCILQRFRPGTGPRERRLTSQYRAFLRRVEIGLREKRINYVDLDDDKVEINKSNFMDSVHLDAQGNSIMAEIIAHKITGARLLRGA